MIMNADVTPFGPELAAAARALLVDAMAMAADEHVVITADSASDTAAVGALQSAAYVAGAQPIVVTLPRLPFQGLLADPYIPDPLAAAVANCDLWIDLTFPYMAGSTPWDRAMNNRRTRYLLAGDMGTGPLVRLYGVHALEPLFALTAAFDEFLRDNIGHDCTMTNAAGTSLRFKLGEAMKMSPTAGVHPGPFFVPGSVVIVPDELSVAGVIKLGTVFHEYYTPLWEPLTLEVDGVIQRIHGGLGESSVLERALRRASGGTDLGHIIHLTCGLHPSARFTGKCFIEDQRVPGFCAVGMGRPFWVPGGGENHPDGIASLTSFAINGDAVVVAGRVVAPRGLAALAREAGI
jgi:2,5-dihydroxypyridine 5,6-dioxygenase